MLRWWITYVFSILIISQKGETFSRDHVSVFFDPFIFPDDMLYFDHAVYEIPQLIKMLTTISTKFSRVMMGVVGRDAGDGGGKSVDLIPMAVAVFNKFHKSPEDPPLELIMAYQRPEEGGEFENLNLALKLADEANHVFNGTVKVILLDSSRFSRPSEGILELWERQIADYSNPIHDLEFPARARSQLQQGNFSYQAGVILYTFECSGFEDFGELLDHFDIAIIRRIPTETENHSEIDTFLEATIKDIEHCKVNLELSKRVVQIEFLVVREDTAGRGNSQNIPDFIKFWMKLSNWALKTNTSLVMFEAFDNCLYRSRRTFKGSAGWWTARGGKLGDDFILEEKLSLLQNKTTQEVELNFQGFSRDHVVIGLNPKIPLINLLNHSEESITFKMIHYISSRFRKVSFTPSPVTMPHEGKMFVLAFAKWNKLHHTSNSKFTPIKVRMQFTLECATFNIAKGIADEANIIYPATVELLSLRRDKNGAYIREEIEEIESQLFNARKVTNKDGLQLGITLPSMICAFSDLSYLKTSLSLVDKVTLHTSPYSSRMSDDNTSESFLRQTFRYFRYCTEKLRKVQSNVSTQLELYWIQKGSSSRAIADLVDVWVHTNNWAIANNVTVVLLEAFDSFTKTSRKDARGWWRLDMGRKYDKPEQYVFLEKAQGLKGFNLSSVEITLKEKNDKKIVPKDSKVSIGMLVGVAAMVSMISLLIIGGLVGCVIFIRRRKLSSDTSLYYNDEEDNIVNYSALNEAYEQ